MKLARCLAATALCLTLGSCGGSDDEPPEYDGPPIECDGIAAQAEAVVAEHCSRCHSPSNPSGGMGYILDAAELVNKRKVTANAPEQSPIYVRASGGTMPPAGVEPRPDAREIEVLRTWINCGAQPW